MLLVILLSCTFEFSEDMVKETTLNFWLFCSVVQNGMSGKTYIGENISLNTGPWYVVLRWL